MSLPFEIVETIIDTLDIHSVRSCARVCHAFLPLSRKRIFASISLNDTESQTPSPTTRMFEQLLSTTPEIAVHIRSLSYCIGAKDFNNGSFHDALKKITRLQSLSIWWYYSRMKFDWKRNPLRPALLHLLHLPTLTHLKLFRLEKFVISDLIPCTDLKELELDFVTAAYAEKKTLLDKSVRLSKFSAGVRSTTVTTRMCSALRPDGKPVFDFTGLTEISFKYVQPECVAASREVLRHCGQLSSIYISGACLPRIRNLFLTLPCILVLDPELTLTGLAEMAAPFLQTLTDLRVDIKIDDIPPKSNPDPLSRLPSELDKWNHKNTLETITIGVFVEPDCTCKQGDEWGELDKALARPGWPALRRVSLAITLRKYARDNGELTQALRKLPETQFPRLSSSETVEFGFLVTTV